MRSVATIVGALAVAAVGFAGSAKAQQFPTSVLGTYKVNVSGNRDFTLTIDRESPEAGTACDFIDGTMALRGVTYLTIHGIYCPSTGKISFLVGRKKDPKSQFLLEVGSAVTGSTSSLVNDPVGISIGGIYTTYYPGGVVGESSFAAVKTKKK